MEIRFCENNECSGAVFKRLRAEYPELDVQREKCIKNCGVCNSALFAVADGMTLRGRNREELYLKIIDSIKAA
jgi:uncharacterized protein YuzB (UPF0349 family)